MSAPEFKLDLARADRLGFEEAIFCERKRPEQLEAILDFAANDGRSLFLTRLSPEQHAALPSHHRERLDYDPVSRTGMYAWVPHETQSGAIALVSAGSSDVPVAAEVQRTLAYSGHEATVIFDVGVAGLWRLMQHVDRLREFRVVIVVAGMDGALPSVVAGLVPGLVIAVPTSVGYGASEAGRTPLNAALASCAPGLVVCNIDNGYGAACAAMRALRR